MYGYGYGYYGFDRTYILLIIGMLLSLAASARLKSTFSIIGEYGVLPGLPVQKQQKESCRQPVSQMCMYVQFPEV